MVSYVPNMQKQLSNPHPFLCCRENFVALDVNHIKLRRSGALLKQMLLLFFYGVFLALILLSCVEKKRCISSSVQTVKIWVRYDSCYAYISYTPLICLEAITEQLSAACPHWYTGCDREQRSHLKHIETDVSGVGGLGDFQLLKPQEESQNLQFE